MTLSPPASTERRTTRRPPAARASRRDPGADPCAGPLCQRRPRRRALAPGDHDRSGADAPEGQDPDGLWPGLPPQAQVFRLAPRARWASRVGPSSSTSSSSATPEPRRWPPGSGRRCRPGSILVSVSDVARNAPSLSEAIDAQHFRVRFTQGPSPRELEERVRRFQDAGTLSIVRETIQKGGRRKDFKKRQIDLKWMVMNLAVDSKGTEKGEVVFSLRAGKEGSARPSEVLAALFGPDGHVPDGIKLLKEGVSFASTARA